LVKIPDEGRSGATTEKKSRGGAKDLKNTRRERKRRSAISGMQRRKENTLSSLRESDTLAAQKARGNERGD